MSIVFALSNVVSLVGVALALWLGFFNLIRSPRRTLTRVAAVTMWAVVGYMLYNLMYYNQLRESDSVYWLSLFRVSAFWGPVLWLHLSMCFLPAKVYRRRQWLVLVTYGAALIWTLFDSIPPSPILLRDWNHGSPLDSNSKAPGDVFPLFIVYTLLVTLLIIGTLLQARQLARHQPALRRHIHWAVGASALTFAGVLYLIAGVQLRLAVPNLPGDLILVGGAGLMGYTVAHEAARRDGRTVQRDFLYSLLAISLVCAAYLLATLISYVIYGIPFVTFIFVLMLAVISHSAYDGARAALDRLFFQQPTRELRANLRALAHEASSDEDLQEQRQGLLTVLGQSLGATRSVLLLRKDGQYVVDATYRMSVSNQSVPASLVGATALTAWKGTPALGRFSRLLPLRAMDQQVGALALGSKENGGPYSADDEDLIADVVERIEHVLAQIASRAEHTRQLNDQVTRYLERERELQAEGTRQIEAVAESTPAVPGFSEQALIEQVEDALRHLSDITSLGEHPLCRLRIVTRRLHPPATTNLDRGKALKELFLDALNKLRPTDATEPKQPGSEWYPFLILREAYVVGVPNRDIMTRYYISQGTFNRIRRRAIRALARALAEMEEST